MQNTGTSGGGYIKNCYSTSNVTGSSTHVGGFIGYYTSDHTGVGGGYIETCYSSGSVSGTQYIGGFIGYKINSTSGGGYIKDCHSSGSVTGSSTHVGGFIGSNAITYKGIVLGYIENCYASGAVSGAGTIGGFMGYNYTLYDNTVNPGDAVNIKGYVKNCYASGAVVSTGISKGGLVGYNAFN